jgi:DNA-binding MarR family transcriptional regulator
MPGDAVVELVSAETGLAVGLIRLARVVQEVFARKSTEHGLTAAQARLLCVLTEGPRGMGELASFLGVEKTAMTGLVDRIELHNLVERTAVPGDRRACRVRLTARGQKVASAVHEAICHDVEALAAGLSATRRHQLARSLLDIETTHRAGELGTYEAENTRAAPVAYAAVNER